MTRIMFAMLLTFLSMEVMGKSLLKQCNDVYHPKEFTEGYTKCGKDKVELVKKYGAELIRSCAKTYVPQYFCHTGYNGYEFCDNDYGYYCDEDYELMLFKKYGAEVVKSCIEVYGRGKHENCDDDSELAPFKKYGAQVVKSCMENYGSVDYCNDDSVLASSKKHGASVINRCIIFHGNDRSKCSTDRQLSKFSEIAPYIEPCRSAQGNACTDCSSVEGVKRFMKGEISKESIGLNYLGIAEFFDIVLEPACSVYQFELRPKYEKYEKEIDDGLNVLIQCEMEHTQSNEMVKGLQEFSEKMISDIKYMSLYKSSLTNEKVKKVFMNFVRDLAKENKLSDKAQISDTGISYAGAEVKVDLSFKDTIDKENNKQSVLQFKSLKCEKQFPPVRKLSYEEYRTKEIPRDCLNLILKKEKIKPSTNVDKVKSKTVPARKSQATTL